MTKTPRCLVGTVIVSVAAIIYSDLAAAKTLIAKCGESVGYGIHSKYELPGQAGVPFVFNKVNKEIVLFREDSGLYTVKSVGYLPDYSVEISNVSPTYKSAKSIVVTDKYTATSEYNPNNLELNTFVFSFTETFSGDVLHTNILVREKGEPAIISHTSYSKCQKLAD